MKKIKQFRFFGTEDINHNTPNTTLQSLVSGSIFTKVLPILQIGIQSLPGTKFYINNGTTPIIIGNSGTFELDLMNKTQISALYFDVESLKLISKSPSAGLIIDVTYESE